MCQVLQGSEGDTCISSVYFSYLKATPNKEIIWDLDARLYFSVYIEAGFYGNWFNKTPRDDVSASSMKQVTSSIVQVVSFSGHQSYEPW